MSEKKSCRKFDDYLGASSPIWRFSSDSDELVLSAPGCDMAASIHIAMTGPQAEEIRRLTGVTSMLLIDVPVFGENIKLHLVGKKTGVSEWAGVAAPLCDSGSVVTNSMRALDFAEGVVSEVNSIVVILDRTGTIHRFNRMAEEYTGCQEENVLGENAQDLFMAQEDGQSSRNNIARFFDEGRSHDVQRTIKTVNGARQFHFRNRFIRPLQCPESTFIMCSGIELGAAGVDNVPVSPNDFSTPLNEAYCAELMYRIMDWAAMVDGARALLASVEEGTGDARALVHAKRIAASAVKEAYGLYEEIDARLLQGAHQH